MNHREEIFQGQRLRLVRSLEVKGIKDKRVLNAIADVPRHHFFQPELVDLAYRDNAYPIGDGQTISQPYTVAFQTQILDIKPGDKVLEIGTGSGYQAAVLCECGAQVFSIERIKTLYSRTTVLLKKLGYNAILFHEDGMAGLPEYAPFDKIIITAGASEIPEKLLVQLNENEGKMVIPLTRGEHQVMMRITRHSDKEFSSEQFGNFKFVPLLPGKV